MSINYNNIKDLVNLLYEFVYQKDKKILDDYEYKRLNPEDIKLDDLIKENIDKQSIINSVLGTKENF